MHGLRLCLPRVQERPRPVDGDERCCPVVDIPSVSDAGITVTGQPASRRDVYVTVYLYANANDVFTAARDHEPSHSGRIRQDVAVQNVPCYSGGVQGSGDARGGASTSGQPPHQSCQRRSNTMR